MPNLITDYLWISPVAHPANVSCPHQPHMLNGYTHGNTHLGTFQEETQSQFY